MPPAPQGPSSDGMAAAAAASGQAGAATRQSCPRAPRPQTGVRPRRAGPRSATAPPCPAPDRARPPPGPAARPSARASAAAHGRGRAVIAGRQHRPHCSGEPSPAGSADPCRTARPPAVAAYPPRTSAIASNHRTWAGSSLAQAAERSCAGVSSLRLTATAAPMLPSPANRHRAHRISPPPRRKDTEEAVSSRVGISQGEIE